MAIGFQGLRGFWVTTDAVCRRVARSQRIASQSSTMITTAVSSGAASASSETMSEPPSSAVATTGLPSVPVITVDLARTSVVTDCVTPAMPPPAMIAAAHFTIGGRSVMTAAETTVPATKAAGVAKVSSRLSTPGM